MRAGESSQCALPFFRVRAGVTTADGSFPLLRRWCFRRMSWKEPTVVLSLCHESYLQRLRASI